jgi:predicted dehydrogenase
MKRFKIVVAGCGGMSKAWITYAKAREDAEIVGLVDIQMDIAQKKASEHGITAPSFIDLSDAIRKTGANLLFDVSTPEAHEGNTKTAMRLGCDVFGEKPMASRIAAARSVTREAKKLGRKYAVMQNRRYLKGIRAFRGLISERLGQVGIVNADFYIGAHFGGFRDLMENVLVLDMAVHTFDMARFISGSDAVSVWCREFNPGWSWYKGDASAVCVFEMANGAVFTYRGSWCAEGVNTTWESDWRVVGREGTAIWNGKDSPWAEIIAPREKSDFVNVGTRVEARLDWQGREGHVGCFDEMFASLIEGRPAETECPDNLKTMEMVFSAIESSRTGKTVKLG